MANSPQSATGGAVLRALGLWEGGYVVTGAMRYAVTDTDWLKSDVSGKHTLAADPPERPESASIEVWLRPEKPCESRDGEAQQTTTRRLDQAAVDELLSRAAQRLGGDAEPAGERRT
jgi:hypothetical protein